MALQLRVGIYALPILVAHSLIISLLNLNTDLQ